MRARRSCVAVLALSFVVGCGGSRRAPGEAWPTTSAAAARPRPTAPPLASASAATQEEPAPKRADPHHADELIAELRTADARGTAEVIAELERDFGGPALARALGAVASDTPERRWFNLRAVFSALERVADPRTADALVSFMQTEPAGSHFRTEAALRLAEIGDDRCVPELAARMELAPSAAYAPERFWEVDGGSHLSRTDRTRVLAVRALDEMTIMQPQKSTMFASTAEKAVLGWATSAPQPHDGALRFLGRVGSDKALAKVRAWAFPGKPIPPPGAAPPFPAAFETAQSALGHAGLRADEVVFQKLLAELKRKPKDRDISQEALMAGPHAMGGMALRALGVGASRGLARVGDARAHEPLLAVALDPTWHEDVRLAACEALAYTTYGSAWHGLLVRARDLLGSTDDERQFAGACLLHAASLNVQAGWQETLLEILERRPAAAVSAGAAVALARWPIEEASLTRLERLLDVPGVRADAAIALLLAGATSHEAVVARIAGWPKDARAELAPQAARWATLLFSGAPSTELIAAWTGRADRLAAIRAPGVDTVFLRDALAKELRELTIPVGARGWSKTTLRYFLFVSGGVDAVVPLRMMGARGHLAALADRGGEVGRAAARALDAR